MKRIGQVFEVEFFTSLSVSENLLEAIEESADLFITAIVPGGGGVSIFVGGSVQETIVNLSNCFGGKLV